MVKSKAKKIFRIFGITLVVIGVLVFVGYKKETNTYGQQGAIPEQSVGHF